MQRGPRGATTPLSDASVVRERAIPLDDSTWTFTGASAANATRMHVSDAAE